MDLSIGKLQQLVAVARCGSFSKAAADLHISQPALSRSIAAIEARYGFPIFNRMGHGVEPTAAGAQVIAQAQPLLQTMRVFDSNLRLIGSGRAGKLSLGLAPLLASQLLARFAEEFFTHDNQAQLRVMIRPGRDLLSALQNDEIELFFFPESHLEASPDIEVTPVGAIRATCVVRTGHPLADRADLTLEDAAGFGWASAVDPPFGPEERGEPMLICDNYHVLREAVLATDLICICSTDFVERQLADGSLREISVEGLPLPATTIYLAKLQGRVNSPLALEAIRRMQAYLAKSSD
jgi:DNA-binding transcriptional LysR family regulator